MNFMENVEANSLRKGLQWRYSLPSSLFTPPFPSDGESIFFPLCGGERTPFRESRKSFSRGRLGLGGERGRKTWPFCWCSLTMYSVQILSRSRFCLDYVQSSSSFDLDLEFNQSQSRVHPDSTSRSRLCLDFIQTLSNVQIQIQN